MAEEQKEAGAAVSEIGGASDTGGLATDLALAEARHDPSLRAHVAAFLDDQRRLIADQRQHLHEQFKSLPKQLRLALWEKWLGVALRLATAFVGLAIAGGLAFLVWDAARSDGLSIEAFSVPPDLAAQGLTGDVAAARLLDRINVMQAATNTSLTPRSVSGNWETRDVRLAIPETGVSLAELENFLRAKLGHVSRLSGEIVRNPAGITMTARVAGSGAVSVSGKEAEMEGLTEKLAEQVYRLTQPNLYAAYIRGKDRADEAILVYEELIRSTKPLERALGHSGRAGALNQKFGWQAAVPDLQRALAIEPDLFTARTNLAGAERYLSHEEAWLQNRKIALKLLSDPIHGNARADFIPAYRGITQGEIDAAKGAFQDAVRARQDFVGVAISGQEFGIDQVINLAAAHDMAAAQQEMAAFAANPASNAGYTTYGRAFLATYAQDWREVLAQQMVAERATAGIVAMRLPTRTFFYPLAVIAEAHLGQFAAAEAKLAAMPGDCFRCMIAHALVAELEGRQARADWWLGQASAAAPSIPFANFEWGRALLERGKPDAAIEKFKASNRQGPHFADALEGWGEALMAKNQSHLALAKFAEAEKYAPNWGRLHLKWGEALVYAGKPAEAKALFTRAAQLDLTPGEKAELTKVSHG
ncbi:MAG: hypothetical protein JO256_03825 [Alphaproteobacteria bacterium]|nr:hypothetical protein [Alphaproteobacteria bacterium]